MTSGHTEMLRILLEALKRASRELERYVDFQQKHDYREYAAVTQKELDAINAVIATAEDRKPEQSATQRFNEKQAALAGVGYDKRCAPPRSTEAVSDEQDSGL